MTITVLRKEESTATVNVNGMVYRVNKGEGAGHISRFYVRHWPLPVDTAEWMEVVNDIRDEDEALYYELFGADIDKTHDDILELWRDGWNGDEPHPSEHYHFIGDPR